MKRIYFFIVMLLMGVVVMAQVPQKISYQALIRDAENELVQNRTLTLQLSIVSSNGTTVYSETHQTAANENGVVSVAIGTGSTSGDFSKIDWSKGDYYVQTTTNLGGGEILVSGSSQLLSVPYALYAEKAGNAVEVDLTEYAKLSDIPAEADLSAYAKSSDLDATYVKKSDVDLSGYYNKSEVDNLFAGLTEEINELKSKLNPQSIPEGAILAAFSVSADKQVYFSQGNLQYQASTNTWRFAEHQWDYVGNSTNGTVYENEVKCSNANISSTYSGWIDLFCWGTSGYNDKFPYLTSYTDYYDGNIASTNYDWGIYNAISNGGNQAGIWRTLTDEEWNYIIYNRTDASSKKGIAIVNDIIGLVLLPDNWVTPTEVTFVSEVSGDFDIDQNTYSASEWTKMEANGAVFLPAAGERLETNAGYLGSDGAYWSSSAMDKSNAFYLCLNFTYYDVSAGHYGGYSTLENTEYTDRNYGRSVRLVQDAE